MICLHSVVAVAQKRPQVEVTVTQPSSSLNIRLVYDKYNLIAGQEYTVIVQNLSNKNMHIKGQLVAVLVCGNEVSTKFDEVLEPLKKKGGDAFLDDATGMTGIVRPEDCENFETVLDNYGYKARNRIRTIQLRNYSYVIEKTEEEMAEELKQKQLIAEKKEQDENQRKQQQIAAQQQQQDNQKQQAIANQQRQEQYQAQMQALQQKLAAREDANADMTNTVTQGIKEIGDMIIQNQQKHEVERQEQETRNEINQLEEENKAAQRKQEDDAAQRAAVAYPSIRTKSASDYLTDGDKLLKSHDIEGAIREYTSALSLETNYGPAYWDRALAYSQNKDFQLAVNDYTSAIACYQDDINLSALFGFKGYNEIQLKDYEKAINDLSYAISLNQQNGQAYWNRGAAYGNKGDYQLAANDYASATTYYQNDDKSLAVLYQCKGVYENELKDYKMAIDDFSYAISLNPQYGQVYWNRGAAYGNNGDYQLAANDYGQAMKFYENDRESLGALAKWKTFYESKVK